MENSIKIESIKTDSDGRRMIAFSTVTYFKGCKPQVSPCEFADYKDQQLRVFRGSSFVSHTLLSFSDALIFLRSSNSN